MDKILAVMKRLRGARGCPWDRKQTLRSLKRCVLEEAHEVIEAIDSNRRERMREEIGDMLCVISLLLAIGEEKRLFDKKALIRSAVRKMIARHPHVFGNEKARTAEDALNVFQKMKEKERRKKNESLFGDLGATLPALMAADKIQRKAARIGFDWPDASGVFGKLDEEMRELKGACCGKNKKRIREEMGDFLFTAVNLARKLGIEPETVLLEANSKFIRRFGYVEKEARRQGLLQSKEPVSLAKLDRFWNRAKQLR